MKTVQDLVDNLNQYFSEEGQFKIDYYDYDKIFEICCENDCGEYDLVEIDRKDKSWLLETDIGHQTLEVQHTIVDFFVNSNPKEWFPEKKYNIIIGENPKWKTYTLYRHDGEGGFESGDFLGHNTLDNKYFQFNEDEIEELKSRLPENLAKIVDLGKVEVKDETSN